jgi:hypothetical protein
MISDEWLAGFFDGEGCISCSAFFEAGKYIKHPLIRIHVSLAQKDIKVLKDVQRKHGGVIYPLSNNRCYSLKWVEKKSITRFLQAIAPYSVCKREQVIQALRFMETVREENLGCVPLPEEVHRIRANVHKNLKKLKVVLNQKKQVEVIPKSLCLP